MRSTTLALVMVLSSAAMAQDVPTSAGSTADLTKPPDLRRARATDTGPTRGKVPKAAPAKTLGAKRRGAAASANGTTSAVAPPPLKAGPDHPLDYGVSFHSANDPRFYSAAPVDPQQVGSGVTAGFKFGF